MDHRSTAIFSPLVGEDVLHRQAVVLVERKHSVVEHIHGRLRQLGGLELAEGEGAIGIQGRLQIDPSAAL
jgi:hypothetical protein